MPISRKLALLFCFVLFCSALWGEGSEPVSKARLESRQRFQDMKFGMFIHWGIYSELADGEWVMETRHLPIRDYEKLAPQFYPIRYDPKGWVALAKAAGMKYITITSRHHDGFSMFQTKQTDWNIVDRTPYKKDALKMLADECHRQGIKVFLYYSQLDWHHPDYFPRGNTGKSAGRPETGNWNGYLDFMNAQLTELLTNYGKIDGIWFDGMWDKPDADWQLERTYQLIHRLQPEALIIPNHHKKPLPGEDVQTFEKDLPGENKAGFSASAELGNLPFETSDTVNKSWGFNLTDNAWKSPKEIIHYLVRAAGRNANLLLNIGPMPNGEIPQPAQTNLRDVGKWLLKNGDSIYGTRGGPVPPTNWGVTTQTADRIFVHVLEPASTVTLSGLTDACSPMLLGTQTPVAMKAGGSGLEFDLASVPRDEIDTVVVLQRHCEHK
ncbi:MAG TPA: alpha-L-fucosidase [Terriglobales bacterium]|nr:alpha-L-fucosidase [Terriglobales bacterium]